MTEKDFGYLIISIHAPLTGSDFSGRVDSFNVGKFQSTLPSQGATTLVATDYSDAQISIHAPLTGSDTNFANLIAKHCISIHAPLTGSDSKYTHKIPL